MIISNKELKWKKLKIKQKLYKLKQMIFDKSWKKKKQCWESPNSNLMKSPEISNTANWSHLKKQKIQKKQEEKYLLSNQDLVRGHL